MSARTTGGGWISTLLGGAVLAVAGFGVGMFAGGLWESPDLVLHYLTGDTEEVAQVAQEAPAESERALGSPLSPAPPLPTTQAVATAATEKPSTQSKLPTVAARPPLAPAAKAPALTHALTSAPKNRMAVQVGAFSESRAAEKLAAGLRAKGYPVYLSPGADSGDARWRVRVGPLASREEAGRTASRLKANEKLPTWVLSEGS